MTRESIDKLARRLAASLPQGLIAVRDDVEQNFRAVLKSSLARMDLVTREEFEVQELVLARTREKLDALEKRLAACEQASQTARTGRKAAGGKSASRTGRKTGKKAGKKKTT